MPVYSDDDLLNIIATHESDRVEFKESLTGDAATRIREAICAFANDLPDYDMPGHIFLGVRNDGTLAETTITDRVLQQLADMKTDGNILPPPSMTVEKRTLRGKEVAVVSVQPSNSPPVRFRGAIHVRTGPRRDIATTQDESILNEKRRHGDRPFDLQPIPTANLTDLNLTQFINEYLPAAFSEEVLTANERNINEQLAATKMIVAADQPVATVLGILTIGKTPQDFIPGAYIQFLRIDGNELTHDIIDAEEIRGAIPELLRQLEEKLNSHNRVAVDIITNTTEQRTELYPLNALQQITRNAVMHRTYESTNAPVHVYWFNDRIEVTSPGGPFGVVTVERFGEHGLVDYRNPTLADAMRTFGFVQRFGVGISIVRNSLASEGYPEPDFEILGNSVRVTVWARRPQ